MHDYEKLLVILFMGFAWAVLTFIPKAIVTEAAEVPPLSSISHKLVRKND